MRRCALGAALLACAACHARGASTSHGSKVTSCTYTVKLEAAGRAEVDARCRASGPIAFRATHPGLAQHVGATLPSQRGHFAAPHGHLSYQVDLAALAGHGRDFDRAVRVGASFLAPLSSVLLAPEPLTTEIPVQVEVLPPPGLQAAVGLQRGAAPGSYRLMAHEIPVATYFAFGKLQQQTLKIGEGELQVSQLDAPLDQSFGDLTAWVERSAHAVRDFYRAFPMPRANLIVMPLAGRKGVAFGKVLPESEPAIALLVGQHATRRELYSDWILVHELFHLGFPSFFEEGKWLDEGLATYYEPIIRARAGLYTEQELWRELAHWLPNGLAAFTESGLENATDFGGIYWGGAIACLVADVTARKRDPSVGLEVGLRALRDAGGVASEVWTLDDVVTAIDRTLGAPTLAPIVREHAQRGAPFDLPALLTSLGVVREKDGSVRLSNAAPLAGVRRAIVAGQ